MRQKIRIDGLQVTLDKSNSINEGQQSDEITREKAIDWWYKTPFEENMRILGKYSKSAPSDSDIEEMYLAEHEPKANEGQQQPAPIEAEILEKDFYMNICRAYNAGKQNQINIVLAKGSPDEDKMFLSSHDYFVTEFPNFKTNVP